MTMTAKNFSDLVSFQRTTVGRYINAAGLMVQAAVNEPRFEYHPLTGTLLGLKMEPQRQNTLTYSQDFSNAAWVKGNSTVTAGQTAPDGTNTAYTVAVIAGTGSNYLYRQNIAWTAGVTYSLSLYAKAGNQNFVTLQMLPTAFGGVNTVNFDLSGNGSFVVVGAGTASTAARIEKLANGWFKLSMTSTCTVTQPAANWIVYSQPSVAGGTYIAWGAQMEIGYGATSYIPTTSAAATRNSDVAWVNDVSPWIRQGEGTLLTDVVVYGGQTFHGSLGTSNGSGGRTATWRGVTGLPAAQVVQDNLATAFSFLAAESANGSVLKQAVAYKLNDFQAATQGTLSPVDTSGVPPTVNRLSLGSRGAGADAMNGYIRKIAYYPYRLTADQLRALTL